MNLRMDGWMDGWMDHLFWNTTSLKAKKALIILEKVKMQLT